MKRLPVFASLFFLSLPFGTLAQDTQQQGTQQQLEQEIRSYDALLEQRRQDAADIAAALGESGAALEARLAERDALSSELAALQTERTALAADLAALQTQIEATTERITQLDRKLDALKLRVQGLLLNLFAQRGNRFGDVLSRAESYHDLQVKNYYLSLLSEQDVGLINELDAAVADLLELQTVQQTQRAELSAKEEEVRANAVEREAKRSELDGLIADLGATRQGQLALQGSLLEEQTALETRLGNLAAALEQERERLAEEARRAEEARAAEAARRAEEARALAAISSRNAERNAPRSQPAPSATPQPGPALELPPLASGYAYPVDTPKLVSAFGQEGIAGVRLQAREPGARVVAVQPGVVADVGFAGSNLGYVVQLQHADGLITAYVNLQSGSPVSRGDAVAQGQVIGYLGGGVLIPADVLELHTGWFKNGRVDWTDPAQLLGF